MRRIGFALVLAALLAAGVPAQDAARDAAQDERSAEPVFGTEVNFVEVDAFVMDEEEEFLRDLTRDDFVILEEGVPQEIAAFVEISIPIERPEETFAGSEPPRDTVTNERPFDGRVYVFVLDEPHVDPRRSDPVRELARRFIDEHMAADDIAAVVITGEADAGQAFTNDKRLLREAVDRFTGRKPASATLQRMNLIEFQAETAASRGREPSEALAPILGRDLDPSDLERTYNARQSMETLERVARGLGGARGRRKSILYYSEGVDYDTLDVMRRVQRDAATVLDSMRRAIGTATRNGVAVYPIDPRGLVTGLGPDDIHMRAPMNFAAEDLQPEDMQVTAAATPAGADIDSLSLDREVRRSLDSLLALATQTGGSAVLNTNDFEPGYDSIVRANSQYYLIGYHPSDFQRDGRFRKIEVRVNRPGVTVVAREGYARPSGEDEERGPGTRAATDTSPEVRELLDRPWGQAGLTLGVTAAAFKGAGGVASVAVTIQLAGRALPFREEGDRAVNEIEVSLLAVDPEGRVRGGDSMIARPRLSKQTHDRVRRLGLRFVRRLELPPGRYQLRVAARETVQGRRGSVFYDLHVPDYEAQTPAMSGVLLTSRGAPQTLTASIDEQVDRLLPTPPTATRTFDSDDVLTAYTEVYDDPEPAHGVTVTARVTDADGLVVFRSTDERASSDLGADGRLVHEVAIPLADLKPGRHVLQIEARPSIGEGTASRALFFDIVPGAGRRASGDVVPPAPGRGSASSRPASRMDRLEAWLAAVEDHEPGTADRPAQMVRSWAPVELAQLAMDLALLARLIEYPKHPVLWITDPQRPTRFLRSPYSTEDAERLRAAAHAAARRCGGGGELDEDEPGLDEDAIRCARNRLLKRGAILHTDAAIYVEDVAVLPGAGHQARPERWRVRFSDGRQNAAQGTSGHWELARSLLENVAPDPEEDDTVRLWYIATSANGQYRERHTRLEEEAADLFPHDPQVLFLAGCLHETFASPTIQSLARSIDVSGTRHGIESEESELKQAEKLFRRALEEDPSLVEARIRLGRVLHLLGRPQPAMLELRQAVTTLLSDEGSNVEGSNVSPDARLMLFYAEMFFGAAAEEVGQLDRAHASYARAAELFPGAPSPRLALSQLALRGNDRRAALEAVQQALQPRRGEGDREDPWWRYHTVQGRDADLWFDRLHRSLADGS